MWTLASAQSTNSPSIQIFFVGVIGTGAPDVRDGRLPWSMTPAAHRRPVLVTRRRAPGGAGQPLASAARESPISTVRREAPEPVPRVTRSTATAASTRAAACLLYTSDAADDLLCV